MATLKSLTNDKYDEHVENLEGKRRRSAELTENEMVKATYQLGRWLLGAVSGDDTEQSAALTELADIFDTTITPPTNLIGTTVTELNTRRGAGVSLTAGNNTVTFSSVMSSTDYTLSIMCYTAAGGQVQYSFSDSDKSVSGFDIHVAAACKIDYLALSS